MYRERLEAILTEYVRRFDEMNERGKNKPDAGYKWRIMDSVSQLNLEADDLLLEFESLADNTNKLMESSRVQPTGGITLLLHHDEEVDFVRKEFKNLLAPDDGDIDDRQYRVQTFIDDINRHLQIYMEKIGVYKQTLNSAIGYLSLLRPDENYFYRPSTAENWAMSIMFSEDFGRAKSFSLRKYYKMCDELLDALADFPEVLSLHEKRMKEQEIKTDDKLHMLVYDIMYCTDAYHLDPNRKTEGKKMTVKERLSLAVKREEEDRLKARRDIVTSRLDALNQDVELPDPSGMTVQHKRYGTGSVTACADGRIEVSFSSGVRKFQFPDAFARGFLSTEDPANMEKFRSSADVLTEKRSLEMELVRLEDSLKQFKAQRVEAAKSLHSGEGK